MLSSEEMSRIFMFIETHFDKLLLTAIFAALVMLVLHMSHDGTVDASAINWARESAGTVLGALLGLITGVAMGKRMSQERENVQKDQGREGDVEGRGSVREN